MTTTPDVVDERVDADALVLRLAELNELIARATEEKQQINLQLIDAFGLGTHETKHARVVISRRGTLDAKKLEGAFPADQYPQLYTPKLTTDLVKEQFAPAALEAYKSYSAPTVTIR